MGSFISLDTHMYDSQKDQRKIQGRYYTFSNSIPQNDGTQVLPIWGVYLLGKPFSHFQCKRSETPWNCLDLVGKTVSRKAADFCAMLPTRVNSLSDRDTGNSDLVWMPQAINK